LPHQSTTLGRAKRRIVRRLHPAAEHEILPDHQAQFIGEVVEILVFVIAAAPAPQHVHIDVGGRLQHAP
jgi:hypothetical protein